VRSMDFMLRYDAPPHIGHPQPTAPYLRAATPYATGGSVSPRLGSGRSPS
jgi:hypothetical protein